MTYSIIYTRPDDTYMTLKFMYTRTYNRTHRFMYTRLTIITGLTGSCTLRLSRRFMYTKPKVPAGLTGSFTIMLTV